MSRKVPPLRERQGDIPLLVRHLLGDEWTVTPAVMQAFEAYHWPGNIRQLVNAMFRAVVLADAAMLTVNQLPQIGAHPQGHALTVPPAPAPQHQQPRITVPDTGG